MAKLRPHHSVQQIAKKHNVDVSFIQNQLDIGEPVEHEHTKDHNLAMDIALQHLDEIPDYYTRLKKMESSAKKELNSNTRRKKKMKDVSEEKNVSFEIGGRKPAGLHKMTKDAAEKHSPQAAEKRKQLMAKIDLPNKKTQSEEKLVDKIISELQEGDPCWKGYTQVGMKKKGGREVPNCVPSKGVPKAKGYKKEEVTTIEDANGQPFLEVIDLVKPEPIKEAVRVQAQTGNLLMVTLTWRGKYYSVQMFFPQVTMPSRKDVSFEIEKIYPGAKVLAYKATQFAPGQPTIQVSNSPSKNYLLNNKTIGEDLEIDEDWQSVNRKDKTDGLSQKAVNAYRKEHPGSKLQTAVTEKNPTGERADRQSQFCHRMKGMKSKLTSAKTAKDPDSNINKALRRWNCR